MTWVPPAFAGLSNSMVVTCKTQHWNKDEGAAPVPNVSPVQPQSMALDPNSKAAPTPTGGMMQPGMVQPGMMQAGMVQPGMMQPGMMQPGMMQPGMMQPGMMQPQGMMMQPVMARPM